MLTEYYTDGLITEREYTAAVRYIVDNAVDAGELNVSDSELTKGVMVRVIDGNTVHVDDTRIRLSLVDVVDSGNSTAPHAVFAREICPVGSTTYYDIDDKQVTGPYGRTIAVVYCDMMAISLNELLIGFGLGWINEYYCTQSEFRHDAWVRDSCR